MVGNSTDKFHRVFGFGLLLSILYETSRCAKPEVPRQEQSLTSGAPDSSNPSSRQIQQLASSASVFVDILDQFVVMGERSVHLNLLRLLEMRFIRGKEVLGCILSLLIDFM